MCIGAWRGGERIELVPLSLSMHMQDGYLKEGR